MAKIILKKQQQTNEAELKGHNNRKHRGGAVKNDGLKPRMSLIPQLSKIEVAKVMTYGAEKYASYNWMKGFDFGKLSDAAERHLTAFNCGEDRDEESGFYHLAHLACCAMMLLENTILHPELDDRWEGWNTKKAKDALKKTLEPNHDRQKKNSKE